MEDEYDAAKVVMRKQKEAVGRYKLDCGLLDVDVEGKKKVKWSDSTELREKMKEYRRSQLSICLDYQHIAIEEEREREGVKRWREVKDKLQNPEEVDDESIASIKQDNPAPPEEEPDYIEVLPDEPLDLDKSDDDPYCNEVLETKLRVIKAKASRHTVLPAYTAALQIYEEWFDSESGSTATQEQKSQLETYKQVVALYNQWDETQDCDVIDESYKAILVKVLEGKKMGEPPQVVADVMNSVLNNEENIKKHKRVYSSMVDDMVTDLSKQIQTTTL